MPCTRQSGTQPLSHVLTPPSGRSRPSLLSKEEQQKAPGSVQDSRSPKHFCSIPNSKTFLLNDRFMEIAAAPLESAAQVAHINWEISRKKAGGAGNKLATPSPSGQGAFYIPPSISITIAAARPHARYNVDDSAEPTHAQRWSEEPEVRRD